MSDSSDKMLDILTDAERRLVEKYDDPGDFIRRFTEWAHLKTDAPSYTLHAAALQVLSLAAGDTTVMPPQYGSSPEYLNLYTMVVGPSTVMRKTTILGFVRDLLPKNRQSGEDYISILDDVSIQAFNKEMAEQGHQKAPVLLAIDEVAGLFQQVNKRDSYLGGFDKTLLKAYDHSPVSIIRVNSKTHASSGAFVNILAASTPEPLAEALGAEDVASGLLPRFLIFDARDAQRGERVPAQVRAANQARFSEVRDELAAWLYLIAKPRADGLPIGADRDGHPLYPVRTLELTEAFLDRYDPIDLYFHNETPANNDAIAAIRGRAQAHIYKLAGLYALSRAGADAQVEPIDLLRAAWLVETTAADLVQMAEEVGSNAHERQVNGVVALLASTKTGRVKRSVIARTLKLSGRETREVLGTLVARGLVAIDRDNEGEEFWSRASS